MQFLVRDKVHNPFPSFRKHRHSSTHIPHKRFLHKQLSAGDLTSYDMDITFVNLVNEYIIYNDWNVYKYLSLNMPSKLKDKVRNEFKCKVNQYVYLKHRKNHNPSIFLCTCFKIHLNSNIYKIFKKWCFQSVLMSFLAVDVFKWIDDLRLVYFVISVYVKSLPPSSHSLIKCIEWLTEL